MDYSITIGSTFLVVFIATLIVLGLLDITRWCVLSAVKIIRQKRRSGLWGPLGDRRTLDDYARPLTPEQLREVAIRFNKIKGMDPGQVTRDPAGVVCPLCDTYHSPSISSRSKDLTGVDDKPDADGSVARDMAEGRLWAAKQGSNEAEDMVSIRWGAM